MLPLPSHHTHQHLQSTRFCSTSIAPQHIPLDSNRSAQLQREMEGVKHTRPPLSSSQSLILSTFAARESASFSVSPGATAAKTSTPLPIDETTAESTVTLAERTRWRIAGGRGLRELSVYVSREYCYLPFILYWLSEVKWPGMLGLFSQSQMVGFGVVMIRATWLVPFATSRSGLYGKIPPCLCTQTVSL